MAEELRARLDAQASVLPSGEFEIACISAGEAKGHGWKFGRDALVASVPLWNNAECFVDHAALGAPRSVRDLGGILYNPAFDAGTESVRATLRTSGPSAALVSALGREMLVEGAPKPRVGFSADVLFTTEGKNVREILRVYSCDLVFEPARGGAFVRALNSVGAISAREERMADQEVVTTSAPAAPAPSAPAPKGESVVTQLSTDLKAIQDLMGAQEERAASAAESEKARAVRAQMCAYLLDSGLAASKLPKPSTDRLRAQFAGKVFEPTELTSAIEDARKLVAELTSGAGVAGITSVHGMFSSGDQVQAAVDDLLDAPREKGAENLHVAKLSGVRELYLMFSGDDDFHGGYYAERARLNTGSFTNSVVNAMNKALVTRWRELGRAGYDWWEKIAHMEHFTDLKQITWLISGTIASLPTVAKGAEYTPLMVGDGKENSSFVKYGGYVGIDLEDMINDDTRKLRAIPKELANAGIRNISALVAALFTDNAAVGPTLADTGALFNSTAVTTAGGHKNLLATALGTDYTAWEAVSAAMYNQPMLVSNDTGYIGTGKKMALDPKFCLVPRALKGQAEALFVPRWAANVEAIAAAGGPTYGGFVMPLTVPEWTDATDWAAVADPLLVPGVCIGEAFGMMPEIFVAGDELSPAVFMNDESRIKVRHWIAVGVADYRPLHKSNVTG